MKTETQINPLESVSLLNGVILIDQEKAETATLGPSPHAKKCKAALGRFRLKTPIHACFMCAIPTIVEIRKDYYDESAEAEEEIILREIRAIAQGTKLPSNSPMTLRREAKLPGVAQPRDA